MAENRFDSAWMPVVWLSASDLKDAASTDVLTYHPKATVQDSGKSSLVQILNIIIIQCKIKIRQRTAEKAKRKRYNINSCR